MIDDLLRETFARHEADAPRTEDLRRGIERLTARRRRRRTAVLTGGTAAAVILVLVAVSLFVRILAPSVPVVPVMPSALGTVPDRALNFLVLGLYDAPGIPAPYRSDSMTLVHIPRDRQAIYLVDFERDVLVDIPGHGPGRINTAHALGGPQLAAAVMQNLTGVPLDGTVVFGLAALGELVDALGPIELCITSRITSIHSGRTFETGCYPFDGDAVTDLVRQRSDLPLGTYTRNANIQRVFVGLFASARTSDLFSDAGRIMALLGLDGINVDAQGIDPFLLGGEVRDLTSNDLVGIAAPHWLPTPDGQAKLLDPVVTPELFAAVRADTMAAFVAAHPDWVANS
jgi:LCP family protein required for cell wall assembly